LSRKLKIQIRLAAAEWELGNTEAVVLVAWATAACCVCGVAGRGADVAIRIGIEIVNRLIK